MKNFIEVEIGGKKRGFRFGMACLSDMLDVLNIGLEEIDPYMNRNPLKVLPVAIYCGAVCHLEDKGESPDFSRNDVSDWIFELEGGFENKTVLSLIETFNRSLESKIKTEGGEAKKK